MEITFVGGLDTLERYSVVVDLVKVADLPRYICSGVLEPYQHYLRSDEPTVYRYAGPCASCFHDQGYPHTPEEGCDVVSWSRTTPSGR